MDRLAKMNNPTAVELIELLQLKPLPDEGGYFVETYRSSEQCLVLPDRYVGTRNFSTAIYYLLTVDTVSRFHRLKSDEVWHFYAGDSVELVLLQPDGSGRVVRLGQKIMQHETSQAIVPHGTWQGARLMPGGKWALLGCTVSPGFEFADFELGSAVTLLRAYPSWHEWISRLS